MIKPNIGDKNLTVNALNAILDLACIEQDCPITKGNKCPVPKCPIKAIKAALLEYVRVQNERKGR